MAGVVEIDPRPRTFTPTGGLRWEWRSFGSFFGVAEQRIRRFPQSEPKESDEIYFLSDGDNVKVRDGLMDIKVLKEVNEDGLEQWAPVMKAKFPLSEDDLARVFSALRVDAVAPLRHASTLDALIDTFDSEVGGVRVVQVHKRRVRYTMDGCMAELSDITANGQAVRTLAVESEDAEAILRVVDSLGLSGYTNTNFRRGLAAIIDHKPERYAVIDVGTNSVKFHLGSRDGKGHWSTLSDRAELTKLGEGLADTGRIGDAPLLRTAEAIAAMAAEARGNDARAIAAVGTAGLRMASNSDDVIAAVEKRARVRIEIVSGEDEARLAYVAATTALGPVHGSIAVFDTGGGSSQFTFGRHAHIDERFSVNVGAARYTERFGLQDAVSEDVLREARAQIAAELDRLDGRPPPEMLVGMGGAVTNMTAVSLGLEVYDPAVVQGAVVSADEIERQIEIYRSSDANARRAIAGLQPNRAEVILAGALIVETVMTKLGARSLTVSDRGLRHGVLAERFDSSGAEGQP
jgi:exopolyphosphatase/guanosine-5'-triphosphate,3'-diphosphate pyrophosphatase